MVIEAREQMALQGSTQGVKAIAEWYQVSRSTVYRALKDFLENACVKPPTAVGRGRKRSLSEEELRQANRAAGRQASHADLAAQVGVSQSTVTRALATYKFTQKRIRARHPIKSDCASRRLRYAKKHLYDKWMYRAECDEKIFCLPGFSGKLRFHEESPVKGEDEEALYPSVASRRHIPWIMVLAVVTRPRFGRHPKSGKIAIV
eukprot:3752764-Prorocentrum_lima.AAC.1